MRHEKIVKRPDGSRVKIEVRLITDWTFDAQSWSFECYSCPPRKRSWTSAVNTDDYSWRKLDQAGRDAESRRRNLTLATEEEVAEAMRELIQKLTPIV